MHVREGNWLFTPFGWVIAVPIPFEAGIVFKTIPEHAVRLLMGESSDELMEAVGHAAMQTLQFNLLPQAVKPMVEGATGVNFFTGQSIVPYYQQNLKPELQYGDKTSAVARLVEKAVPDWLPGGESVTPYIVDNTLRGYFGSAATYALAASDAILHNPMFGFTSENTDKMLVERPLVRRFFKDGIGPANEQAYWSLVKELDGVTASLRVLSKQDPKKAIEYRKSNQEIMELASVIRETGKMMSQLRDLDTQIKNSQTMTGAQKQSSRRVIKERKAKLLSLYPELKRRVG